MRENLERLARPSGVRCQIEWSDNNMDTGQAVLQYLLIHVAGASEKRRKVGKAALAH